MATPASNTVIPRIGGFHVISAHECPRCDALARILYAATPGEAQVREGTQMDLYREFRTPQADFAELIGYGSFEEDTPYAYFNWRVPPCGYVLPLPAPDKPESFIQQLYGRFFTYPHKPVERIVRFNVEALLASPLVIQALPREVGPVEMRKPIMLIAAKPMLRYIMATGQVPPKGTNIQTLNIDAATSAKAAQDFLGLIEAETMRIRI